MKNAHYPIYISNAPEGKDSLKGESHNKIANEIANVITTQSNRIQRQVIGLEGDWGSGKSNIIKILEDKKLNEKNYLHFVFDTWGHQEDLNRRAILEELIDFIGCKRQDLIDDEWRKKKKQLTGKTINSEKSSYPEIKFFWVLLMSSFLCYIFLKEIFPFFEQKNIIPNYSEPLLKKFLFVFLFPLAAGIIGLTELYKEFIILKSNPDNKDLAFKSLIGQLFSFIQGKEVKTNTTDFVMESEPSNKNFREFLDFINKRLKDSNITLILTIDNIDRLTRDKIKSLWSTVNIFFADKNDKKYYDNIWLIIPYDETKILNAFSEENDQEIGVGLIEKTFSVKFRVTPPIPSNWELLFEKKLEFAFGKEIIPREEIDYIKRIFDGYSTEIITPREIINFINDLITIYVINQDIAFRYLALFVAAKKEITKEPVTKILSNDYLNERVKMIFGDDDELQKNISAITFGVSVDMAEEVVYSREIKNLLYSGSENELLKFKNNPLAFRNNFYKVFSDLNLNNCSRLSFEKLPIILVLINEHNLIDKYHLDRTYWPTLKKFALNINKELEHNLKLNSFHKQLCNYNIEYGKELLEKCIENIYYQIRDSKSEIDYIKKLKEIDEFLIETTDFNITALKFNPSLYRSIDPDNYLELLEAFPDYFSQVNLAIDDKKLYEYLLDSDSNLELDYLSNNINDFVKIKQTLKFDYKPIIEKLKSEMSQLKASNLKRLLLYHKCLKALSNERPFIDISLPFDIINQEIEKCKTENVSLFEVLVTVSLMHIDEINSKPFIKKCFEQSNVALAKKVVAEVEFYKTYGDIIKIISKNTEFLLVKEIAQELTQKSYGQSTLNVQWILENYGSILEKVFDNNKTQEIYFFKRFDSWSEHVKKHLNLSNNAITKIDLKIIESAMTVQNNLSKILIDKSNEYLKSLSDDQIISIIKNQNVHDNRLFKVLYIKNKVNDDFYKMKIQPLILVYLENFAQSEEETNTDNFVRLRNLFVKIDTDKKNVFIRRLPGILNKNQDLSSNQVHFFSDWIMSNNLLPKVNVIFLKHFIKGVTFSRYFQNNHKLIIDIVSKMNDKEVKKLIWDKVKHKHKDNEIKKYAIKKGLKN